MMNRQPNDRYRQPPYLAPVVEFFQLLADPARLGILVRLAKGERNVSGLRDALELPQPTVSHHLKLLRAAGLVARRRSGKFVLYRLEGRALTDPGGGSLRMSGEHCGIEIRLHMERSAP